MRGGQILRFWEQYTSTYYGREFKKVLSTGSRNFRIPSIARNDLMTRTEEAARVSGIPDIMTARYDEAIRQLPD
jgi:hypothetical protein